MANFLTYYRILRFTVNFCILFYVMLLVPACKNKNTPQGITSPSNASKDSSTHKNLGAYAIGLSISGEGSLQQFVLTVHSPKDTFRVEGEVEPIIGWETADLDADSLPEIILFTQSAGSGSYGSAIGFTLTVNKGLQQIILPELSEDSTIQAGYGGHDQFKLDGKRLIRRFPIYTDYSSNSQPSDTSRIVFYSFVPDSTSPRFKLEGAMIE
jgi:hypothetical protein